MSKTSVAAFLSASWQQIQRASTELGLAHLKGSIEALIYAAPSPMKARDLVRSTKAQRTDVEAVLAELVEEYQNRGIQLWEGPHGWQFLTNPRFGDAVRAVTGRRPVRMSRQQLETLAIIAYRQPITRPEIDDIRGVDSGPVLRTLLDRDLIRVLGKKEEPGRPLLYGTADTFLELLNLKSLGDLPTLREFTELTDTSRDTYERRLGEAAPAGAIIFDDDPDEPIDPTEPLDDELDEEDDDAMGVVDPENDDDIAAAMANDDDDDDDEDDDDEDDDDEDDDDDDDDDEDEDEDDDEDDDDDDD